MTPGDLRRKAELTGTVSGSAMQTMTVAAQAEAQTEGTDLDAAEVLTGGLAIDMHTLLLSIKSSQKCTDVTVQVRAVINTARCHAYLL